MNRGSGLLMHISSLKSAYGIGSLGRESYKFVDFVKKSGCKYWQVLPLSPTGYGDSPYQACSCFALNPYFIDLDFLFEDGLLNEDEIGEAKHESERVDYEWLFKNRFNTLRKAYGRFNKKDKAFTDFILKKDEFYDYAVYMAVKEHFKYRPVEEWEERFKMRRYDELNDFIEKNENDILFWLFTQYIFLKQWNALKQYAHKKGVLIVGDMAIYTALDSVEVWKTPEMFKLNSRLIPIEVAGVPPDYFSADGQLWGNPLYDWDYHKSTDFAWWKKRINHALNIYDIVRIDHFRGFDRYFAVKYGKINAREGMWRKGPGIELFEDFLGKNIIAEDLGLLDNSVLRLIKKTGYPGMKVMVFGLDGDDGNPHKASNAKKNCILYTGTHDNQTLSQFIQENKLDDIIDVTKAECEKMNVQPQKLETTEDVIVTLIELGFKSAADTFIVPYQDCFCLGKDARMNLPSTVSLLNWSYRDKENDREKVAFALKRLNKKYNRIN